MNAMIETKTPTPETDDNLSYGGTLVSAEFARELECERNQLRAENEALREVSDRLATHGHNHGINPDASQRNICVRCCAIRDYNQLPHVKERHKL